MDRGAWQATRSWDHRERHDLATKQQHPELNNATYKLYLNFLSKNNLFTYILDFILMQKNEYCLDCGPLSLSRLSRNFLFCFQVHFRELAFS